MAAGLFRVRNLATMTVLDTLVRNLVTMTVLDTLTTNPPTRLYMNFPSYPPIPVFPSWQG